MYVHDFPDLLPAAPGAINRQSLLVLASSISGRPDVSKAVDAG